MLKLQGSAIKHRSYR